MTLNVLDIVIVLAVAGGLARGFTLGAVRQVTSLIGVVAAFALAVQLMRRVGDLAVQSLGIAESAAPVLGFLIVFLAVQALFYLIGRLIEHLLDVLKLSIVNRVFGSAVGGFKAAILLSISFLVLTEIGFPSPEVKQESALYRPVAQVLPETWEVASRHVPDLKQLSEQFGRRIEAELPAASQ